MQIILNKIIEIFSYFFRSSKKLSLAARQTETKFDKTRGNGQIIVGPCISLQQIQFSLF